MVQPEQHHIHSFQILFGKEQDSQPHIQEIKESLAVLELEILKKTYRSRIKDVHPDRAVVVGKSEEELNAEASRVNGAYQNLLNYLNEQNNKRDNFYFKAPIPGMKFRFAEFLFYSGIIDWNTLIQAIVWQFCSRPKFGEIALKEKFLTHTEILAVLREKRIKERFGETAVRTRKLNLYQLQTIIRKQRIYNLPIGKYFIEKNILNERQMKDLLFLNQVHNFKYPD